LLLQQRNHHFRVAMPVGLCPFFGFCLPYWANIYLNHLVTEYSDEYTLEVVFLSYMEPFLIIFY
jgi:hypothetical protein